MRQPRLPDDAAGPADTPVIGGGTVALAPVPALRPAGPGTALSKTQKQFNALIERLQRQREEIARWQAFKLLYHRQLADKYEPLAARLREKRIAMARLLDRAIDGDTLGKRDRSEALGMLTELLSELLDEARDPELVRLHDKYAHLSFDEELKIRLALLRRSASEDFGVDVDAYQGEESAEHFADWLKDQARRRAEPPPSGGKKQGAAAAREALMEQAAHGGTRAVREVFGKLVSELHPDRESDPAEHARKTELMQRVNQAYSAGDLLSLLEMQFSVVTFDSAVLGGLAKERLQHYVFVLEAQSKRLRGDLAELIAPFERVVAGASRKKLTPEAVQRALDEDIREIKRVLRTVEFELVRFRDVRLLKQSLGGHRR